MKPLRRTEALTERAVDGELLVIDHRSELTHLLTPELSSLWSACDGRNDEQGLTAETGLGPDAVIAGLSQLEHAQLLQAGSTRRAVLRGGLVLSGAAATLVVTAPLASAAGTASDPVPLFVSGMPILASGSYRVPSGVTRFSQVVAIGGNGGQDQNPGLGNFARIGLGAVVTTTQDLTVVPGEVLTVVVGTAGGEGYSGTGGAGGVQDGGAGGGDDQGGYAAGGGGGSTSLTRDVSLVVAGGGGGAGGGAQDAAATDAAGGNAASTQGQQTTQTVIAGASGTGTGGGAAGGGGGQAAAGGTGGTGTGANGSAGSGHAAGSRGGAGAPGSTNAGGGGGGGYTSGGGGGSDSSFEGGGGGGGSSYALTAFTITDAVRPTNDQTDGRLTVMF